MKRRTCSQSAVPFGLSSIDRFSSERHSEGSGLEGRTIEDGEANARSTLELR